jgi:hypothetical protein
MLEYYEHIKVSDLQIFRELAHRDPYIGYCTITTKFSEARVQHGKMQGF